MTGTAAAHAIRVLVVDDEALIRSGLAMILGGAPDIRVVATCSGSAALAAVREHRPDVVLLDIRMPEVDGLTVLAELQGTDAPPQVAMLTAFDDDEYVAEALRLGAVGFLLKDTPPEQLMRSVRALASGGGCLSHSLVRRLRQGTGAALPARRTAPALSARDCEILNYLGHGLTNGQIAARMNLGVATVKDHVKAVVTRIGAANRIQAAVLADRWGLVEEYRP